MIGVIYLNQTVQQAIDELPERITKIRVYNDRGMRLGIFSRSDAIEKYGHYIYTAGYSDGFTEISIWILKPNKMIKN